MKFFTIESLDEDIDVPEIDNEIAEVAEEALASESYTYIDTTLEALDGFTRLYSVKTLMETKEVTPLAIESLRLVTNSILKNIDRTHTDDIFLAAECFRSPTSSQASINLALEAVVEKLKNTWTKIKDMIIAMFDKIYVGWTNLINTFPRKLATVTKLIEQVKGMKNVSPKESTIVGKSSFAKAFISNDINLTIATDFTEAHIEMTKFNLETYGWFLNFFKSDVDAAKNFKQEPKEIKLAFGNIYKYTFDHGVEDKGGAGEAHSFIPNIVIAKSELQPPEAVTLTVLKKGEMDSLLKKTTELLNKTSSAVSDMSKKKAEIAKAMDDLSKVMDKKNDTQANPNTEKEEGGMAVLNDFKKAITTLSKLAAPILYAQNLKLVDLNIEYVKRSMAAH